MIKLKSLEEFIYNCNLLEMAFNRKQLIDKIKSHDNSIMEHTLNILFFQQFSDWDQTLADIINIFAGYYTVKQNKNIMTNQIFLDNWLNIPYKDINDDWIEKMSKLHQKRKKGLSVKYIPSFSDLLIIYKEYYKLIITGADRDDIKKIFKEFIK